MPSGGGRVRSLVLVMMLETLWPPGGRRIMGWAIFMGEQSNGPPATGMLVPGYGAEQQGLAGG